MSWWYICYGCNANDNSANLNGIVHSTLMLYNIVLDMVKCVSTQFKNKFPRYEPFLQQFSWFESFQMKRERKKRSKTYTSES